MNTGPSDARRATGFRGLVGQSDVFTLFMSSTEMQSLSDNPFRDFFLTGNAPLLNGWHTSCHKAEERPTFMKTIGKKIK